MSGAEFIAVAGVISSIIAIADGIKQVVDAASEVEGLPKAFRQASSKLPLVSDILEATRHNFEADDVLSIEKSVTLVVDDCKDKWTTLKDLFDKVIPEENASRGERYYKAVKTLGKGGKVESLMKGILEDIQLLATIKTMTTTNVEKVIKVVTAAQEEKVTKAITDVTAWPPSVPDEIFQEGNYTNINYGAGQYIAQGNAEQNIFQGEARQYHTGGGPQTINEALTINNDIHNIHLLQSPKKDEARACLTALFLTDPRDDREKLIHMKGSRVDGTCEWIKTNAIYELWLRSHSQLLWVSGGPGKGKTMLSIFLTEELRRKTRDSPDVSILQYFCDNKDEKRNTAIAVIRGMIFQLLQLRPKLIDHILPSYEIQKKSLFTASSFETLWRIFETMLHDPMLGTIYSVLDGLDEIDEASLEVLLKKFRAFFLKNSGDSSPPHFNLIVMSRDLPEFIPEILSSFPRIRLDPDADIEVNNDIHQFIEVRVDELSMYRQYPEPLRIYVKEVFQNRAQGTFLWVGIVAKALRKYKATEVEKALKHFPSGLDELYARMLLQIDIGRRETAAKILYWVVMAVRPLTLSELSAAVETTSGPSSIFDCDQIMRDQVSHCGYFLTIKEDEVSLIHQSAKDYLLRKSRDSNPKLEVFRVKEEIANLEIARKCFYYLQNGALTNGEVNLEENTTHLRAFPLLLYAALHWPEHARSLARSEDIFDLSLPFYHEKSQIRISWFETYWAMEKYGHPPKSFTLLHLASYFGILPLAENLLLKKGWINKVKRLFHINKIDDQGQTALHLAVQGGHEAVVRLLVEKGADVEPRDRNKWTALHRATNLGNEAMVRLLVENGADVEARDRYGGTALHQATLLENEAVVRLLVEKGTDVEARDRNGERALHFAAQKGHEAVVRLLVENGADVEARDLYGETALHRAAMKGHEAVVRLLVEKGADVEPKDEKGQTALHWAAQNGYEAMMQLLVEKGADVEAKDKSGRTALHWAALKGHDTMMWLLVEKGADVEAKDENGKTALHWAAQNGYEAVVRLLVEKGTDVEARDEDRGMALHYAALNGHEAVVRLLVEKGTDVEARDENGGTALHYAALNGHEAVVQLLVEKGTYVEARGKSGRTALHYAAQNGHEAVVWLLVKKGADVEAKDESGRTALRWAAQNGHDAVVQLLVGKGADVEAKDENGKTTLHYAALNGHKAVVRLLVETGADVEAKDKSGRTALHWAVQNGHDAVVWLLVGKGADVEAKDENGKTALHYAAQNGHDAVVWLLVGKGADVEAKDTDESTALHYAALNGHKAVVRLLVEKGADVEAKDTDESTALH